MWAMRCGLLSLAIAVLVSNVCAEAMPSNEEKDSTGQAEKAGDQEKDQAPPGPLPAFANIRYDEDWSVLRTASGRGPYESLKFVPLNESGSAYLSLGGQLRLRGEGWSDFGFGGTGNRDDFFGLLRLRVHGDVWLGSRFRFFVEGKSSLSTDRDLPGGLRTLDVDTVDLQNAVVDVKAALEPVSVTFRVGRQELQFGKQRLVSPLDWSNTRRTFDGARAIVRGKSWRVDGFWSKAAPVKKYSFNTSTDSGIDFFGIYGNSRLGSSPHSLDFYWLGLENDQAGFGGVTGRENRHTFGGRLSGTFSGKRADYDLEAALQVGDHASRDIRAGLLASQLGYRVEGVAWAPRIYLGFDYASGDSNPADGKLQTFSQLFPLGHAYLGYVDIIGRQNILDFSQGVSTAPSARWTLAFDLHNFWRASTSDALYNAGGAVVRSGSAGNSRYVGLETDLTASFRLSRFVAASAGYSHIFPAKFIEESGSSEGTDFVYVTVQTTF